MKYKITLCGRTYEIEVDNGKAVVLDEYEATAAVAAPEAAPASVPAAPAAAAPVVTGAGETVAAPMPGTILKVNVAVGDKVAAGQLLVVLEAMKMENEILASKAGTVTQVLASRGSTVDTGAPLVVIGEGGNAWRFCTKI